MPLGVVMQPKTRNSQRASALARGENRLQSFICTSGSPLNKTTIYNQLKTANFYLRSKYSIGLQSIHPPTNAYKNTILKVIHVFSLINNSHKKAKKCANIQVILLHTIFPNSDTLRSILITFMEPLNINKTYTKHRRIIKYIQICPQNVCRYYKIRLQQWRSG